MLLEKVIGQPDNLVLALPKRRHIKVDHIEPVIKVLPERPFPDSLLQIAVGGGHDADVDKDGVTAAEGLKLAVLEHLKQLGLEAEIHVPDLVEKNGAAAGHLEFSGAILKSAGERAALVAEQLALDQFRR